jgi:hypothetical protein
VNWPARSLVRKLTEAERGPRSIRRLRAAWVVHPPSGRSDAGAASHSRSASCGGSKPTEHLPNQSESVIGDYHSNGQRHCRIQPVPASRDQDDPARCSHTRCRGGIRDRVQEDRRDGQIPFFSVAHGIRMERERVVVPEQPGEAADELSRKGKACPLSSKHCRRKPSRSSRMDTDTPRLP